MKTKLTIITTLILLFTMSSYGVNATTCITSENSLLQPPGTRPALGVKDFLWIRVEFEGGKALPSDNKQRIEGTMSVLGQYLKKHSNGKTSLGNYEITPVFKSNLTNEKDLKNNHNTIRSKMIEIARNNGVNVNRKFIYLMFTAKNLDIGGGALGSGNGDSGTGWIPSNIYPPGVIHETFHMLGVGHAENIFGDKEVFPGISTGGGHDPYFFMGSEGNSTVWANGAYTGEINATINLPMKRYMHWLDPENIVDVNHKNTFTQRIYVHDVDGYPGNRKLGILLNDYSSRGSFMVSYVQNVKNRAIKTNGVLIHEISNNAPAVSRILDLRPNSVEGNPFRPGSQIFDYVFEFGDAALGQNEQAAIGNLFKIKVVREGGQGKDKWADVQITSTFRNDDVKVDLSATKYDYDLGTEFSPVENGWTRISPITKGDIRWTGDPLEDRDRGIIDGVNNINRDFVLGTGKTTLNHKIKNGNWMVKMNFGDAINTHEQINLKIEGKTISNNISSKIKEFTLVTSNVTVTDGTLNIELSDNGGVSRYWVLNRLSLERIDSPAPPGNDVTEYKYDVGTNTSVVWPDYTRLSNTTRSGSFGWANTNDIGSRDRGAARGRNNINRDINFSKETRFFTQNVSNGNWNVLITFGDTYVRRNMNVTAEGQNKLNNINTNAGQYLSQSFNVNVNDGKLDLRFSVGNGGDVWSITRIWLRKQGAKEAQALEDQISSINELKIYPNPATDIVKVRLHNYTEGVINIFNGIGQKVYQKAFDNSQLKHQLLEIQVDVSVFPRGAYLLYVQDKNGYMTTHKMVLSE